MSLISIQTVSDLSGTVKKALGIEIEILKSTEYCCVEDCIRVFGGFRDAHSGFAPCTNWLKKRIRKEWEAKHPDYDLTYVWGYDLNEIPVQKI